MNKRNAITILTALAICSIVYTAVSMPADRNKPNVIIINLDALRPDHLGCYGYSRNTSPHIDEFARNSNLYLNCFSPGTWTIPANYSLLTSIYLDQHNMDSWDSILDKKIPTIFSELGHYGYAQGFFSNSEFLEKNFKENFSRILNECSQLPDAHAVTKNALYWIKQQRSPFFAWIYYLEPHRPYIPPQRYKNLYKYPKGIKLPIKRVAENYLGGWDYIPKVVAEKNIHDVNYYIAQYDGEIHYADEEIGELLTGLKKLGLFDRSLIILTSDHGESLGEHHLYFNHMLTLFNEVIRIPLLIKMPAQQRGIVIRENVSSIDILPTVLSNAGINNRRNYEGINLSGKPGKKRGLFAYLTKDMYCFVYDEWKIIKYPSSFDSRAEYIKKFFPEYGPLNRQLFNIVKDPMELADLKSPQSVKLEDSLFKLSQKRQRMKPMAKAAKLFEINEEGKEKLRSLGYAQ